MPFSYNITANSPDSHQSNPWWFAVVVRFKHERSFDRSYITGSDSDRMNVSLDFVNADPVAEREPLLLSNQIVSWQVNQQKGSHTSSAVFRVLPGAFQFESQTHAGDWVLFWAFDNVDDYRRVLDRTIAILRESRGGLGLTKTSDGANGFMDGLKFVGRLNAPMRSRSVDAMGMQRKEYELTAVAFGEFDSKIYYTPAHHAKYEDLRNGFVAQLHDVASNNFASTDEATNGLPLTTQQHAQLWLETFLGAGPGAASKGFDPSLLQGSEEIVPDVESALMQSPNDIFMVPQSVGKLLGVQPQTVLRYYDLLNVFMGVQGPNMDGTFSVDRRQLLADDGGYYAGFVPVSVGELSGSFRAQMIQLGSMVTVWDLVSSFSNAPINEMFVSLRVNAQGKVGPSFVMRQNPMSSPLACKAFEERGWAMTNFMDVPRWVISDKLFVSEKVGPSDSMHYNYVKVQGVDLPNDMAMPLNMAADALSPAMADIADIKRSGLRPAVINTNCNVDGLIEARGPLGRAFTQFMSDILLDQHLKWSGSLSVKGIQEPIAVGDNCEWDGVVYHIEGVTHSGHIDQAGHKTFNTSLSLSNGVSVISAAVGDNVMPYEAVITPDHTDYETRSNVKDVVLENGAIADQELAQQQAAAQADAAKKNAHDAAEQAAYAAYVRNRFY